MERQHHGRPREVLRAIDRDLAELRDGDRKDPAPCAWCGSLAYHNCGDWFAHCDRCTPRAMRFGALVRPPIQYGTDALSDWRAEGPLVSGQVGGAKITTSDAKAMAGFAKQLGKPVSAARMRAVFGGEAKRSRSTDSDDPLAEVAKALAARSRAEKRIIAAAQAAKDARVPVRAIGEALGMTRQGVYAMLERA